MRTLLIACTSLLALTASANADTVFDFSFNEIPSGLLDAQGSFTTGAASTQDAGYLLLTSLTFTALRETSGTLDTGSLSGTGFVQGSACDSATEAFVNHSGGNTFANLGLIDLKGSTGPNNFGSTMLGQSATTVSALSFSQGGTSNELDVQSRFNGLTRAAKTS